MRTTDSMPTLPTPTAVPLARDAHGEPIQVPEGAMAWRIRRHTGGRPRHHLDSHKQPMLFPLHYSVVDAEEILPPGTYRLDLVDASGELLEVTVPITIAGPRIGNDATPDATKDENDPTTLPGSASDMRLVLEANVRSTQLAFQHNERTLTASLRMADTLRDGVQVLAEAQADWIKAIASSRGFLRNAAAPALPTAQPLISASEEARDDDDDDDVPQNGDRLVEFGMAAMTLVNNLIETFRPGGKPDGPPGSKPPRPGFDLRSLLDWRRAAPPPAEEVRTQAAPSPTEMLRLLAGLPPELMTKLRAVRELLDPDEQAKLMPFVMALAPDELAAIAAELMPRSVDEIAAMFRAEVSKLPKV